MKNQIIEQFIETKFSENEIIGLHEETGLVCHLSIDEVDKEVVEEIKQYGYGGYNLSKFNGGLVIYYVENYDEIWMEGGYEF